MLVACAGVWRCSAEGVRGRAKAVAPKPGPRKSFQAGSRFRGKMSSPYGARLKAGGLKRRVYGVEIRDGSEDDSDDDGAPARASARPRRKTVHESEVENAMQEVRRRTSLPPGASQEVAAALSAANGGARMVATSQDMQRVFELIFLSGQIIIFRA